MTFHEVLARTVLNQVPLTSWMLPGAWTINPYRGCSHACLYCYARSTHRYLDLDAGADFDTQIVVKVNVAEVLARELATKKVLPDSVALGTNTDPYQRAEGRYRLMPGIIGALREAGVALSILTKGTLLRRDLALLAEVSETQPVSPAMSIAIFDDASQQSLEPGTPTTAARLATVRMVRDAGMGCAVFIAPVIPGLTDSTEQLDRALDLIEAAGATSVRYTALRLGPHVKELFLAWLAQEHPELLPRYRELYGQGSHTPGSYRRLLDTRMGVLRRRHGLHDGAASAARAGEKERSTAGRFSLNRFGPGTASGRPRRSPAASDSPPGGMGKEQPLLF
jgi:DNA repair photolyase